MRSGLQILSAGLERMLDRGYWRVFTGKTVRPSGDAVFPWRLAYTDGFSIVSLRSLMTPVFSKLLPCALLLCLPLFCQAGGEPLPADAGRDMEPAGVRWTSLRYTRL